VARTPSKWIPADWSAEPSGEHRASLAVLPELQGGVDLVDAGLDPVPANLCEGLLQAREIFEIASRERLAAQRDLPIEVDGLVEAGLVLELFSLLRLHTSAYTHAVGGAVLGPPFREESAEARLLEGGGLDAQELVGALRVEGVARRLA
jgi:hypothetical protein